MILPQSEVERARAHLRRCQEDLAAGRACPGARSLKRLGDDVLAALSWLWDAQQREIVREGEEALAMMIDQAQHGLRVVLPAGAFAFLDSAR